MSQHFKTSTRNNLNKKHIKILRSCNTTQFNKTANNNNTVNNTAYQRKALILEALVLLGVETDPCTIYSACDL